MSNKYGFKNGIDRGIHDPYDPGNDSIMYGYENLNGIGAYQRSNNVANRYDNLAYLGANAISDDVLNAARDDGLMLGYSANDIRKRAFDKFSKFGYIDPFTRTPGHMREVLFFTKPDLHLTNGNGSLCKGLSDAPFFIDIYDKWPMVIDALEYSNKNSTGPFMQILHNRVRDTLDLPDISSNDIDLPANMYGNDYTYRGSSEPSDDQYTFNLEFEDNKYLDVYMLFRAYEEYERYKKLGLVMPRHRYISNKILHDQISIYKFILMDDYTTIYHYSKLWGCYPTGLPRSVFGSTDFSSSGLTLSIPWKCAFIEDMNPLIVEDFNLAMSKFSGKPKIDLIAPNGRINRSEWADGAYIVEEKVNPNDPNSRYVYKLEWRKQ